MVNGIGLGFNYNQNIIIMKQYLAESFLMKANEKFGVIPQGFQQNNVQNYTKSFTFPSHQLSDDHHQSMFEMLDEMCDFFIMELEDIVDYVYQTHTFHERKNENGEEDSTYLYITVTAIPSN